MVELDLMLLLWLVPLDASADEMVGLPLLMVALLEELLDELLMIDGSC